MRKKKETTFEKALRIFESQKDDIYEVMYQELVDTDYFLNLFINFDKEELETSSDLFYDKGLWIAQMRENWINNDKEWIINEITRRSYNEIYKIKANDVYQKLIKTLNNSRDIIRDAFHSVGRNDVGLNYDYINDILFYACCGEYYGDNDYFGIVTITQECLDIYFSENYRSYGEDNFEITDEMVDYWIDDFINYYESSVKGMDKTIRYLKIHFVEKDNKPAFH